MDSSDEEWENLIRGEDWGSEEPSHNPRHRKATPKERWYSQIASFFIITVLVGLTWAVIITYVIALLYFSLWIINILFLFFNYFLFG